MRTIKHLPLVVSVSLLAVAAEPTTGGFQIGVLTCVSDPETQKSRIVAS